MDEFEIVDGVLEKFHGEGGDVVIPAGVRAIGFSAFECCPGLTSVVIPEGVTEIGKNAFRSCTGLVSVTIPEILETITLGAFRGCDALATVTIRGILLEHATLDLLQRKCLIGIPQIISQLVDYRAARYGVVWTAFWHCPEDERNNAFILAHCEKMLCYLIDVKDALTLEEALRCGAFDKELKECIDRGIEYAIAKGAVEMQLMLTNYKAEKIGYVDAAERLML